MNPTRCGLSLLVGLAVALAATAEAAAAEPETGSRVRVTILARETPASTADRTFRSGDSITGTLLAHDPARIALRPEGSFDDTLTIPRALVASFETSRGQRSRSGQYAAFGAFAGAAAAALYNSQHDSSNSFIDVSFFNYLAGIGGGLALGAIVGNHVHRERWETAALP